MSRGRNASTGGLRRRRLLSTAALLAIMPAAGIAHAQTVNYGALEKLFAEPVTTSATGLPQPVSEVPVDMEIVTADDIRRSGAIDLPGVLQHVAGVDVLQWANTGADVSVHGYNQPYSSRLLVLIDGRQVYTDYYGFTPWSALPVELGAIRQIEVVKGPNSALFGFNAVGGVINIITSNPLYDDLNTASLGIGNQGLAQGSVVSTFRIGDRAGVRVEAGGRSNDGLSTAVTAAERHAGRGNDRDSFDVDGLVQLADDIQFDLEASHVDAHQTEMIPTIYSLGFTTYESESLKGQLTADTPAGQLQGTAYTNWIHSNVVSDTSVLNLVFNNQVTVVQLQDLIRLNADHTLRGSIEYRNNSVNTTPDMSGTISYDIVSSELMWDWKILTGLSLTNALRIDHLSLGREGTLIPGMPFANAAWNRSITEPSFNSGIVWQSDDLNTFRLTASRGVQLPNLEDLGGLFGAFSFNGLPVVGTGLPTLSPTVVTNYELGWDRTVPEVEAVFRFSLYHQTTRDFVSNLSELAATPVGLVVTPGNIGDSSANGIEISVKGHFAEDWRWGVAYTPEIVTDHFKPGNIFNQFPTNYQHTTPVNTIDANLGWSGGRWEVDGFLRYRSDRYGLSSIGTTPALTRIGDTLSFDGRVAYALTDWATLALSGQNLGQARQRQTAAPDVERRIVGAISARF